MSRLSARIAPLKKSIANFWFRVECAKTVYDSLKQNLDSTANRMDLQYISSSMQEKLSDTLQTIRKSNSQIGQDMFVLMELDFKRNGYFVEFGAANGIELSNSHMLEENYGWTGILAEPAHCWHEQLLKNRDCIIDRRCVWHTSGQIMDFSEPREAVLATIAEFATGRRHDPENEDVRKYQVETVSLMDLLIEHDAPQIIDYLSIDTEGSEFEILSAFDFDRFDIRVITCEHNYTSQREKIYELLTAKGYVRKFRKFSRMDDWYVKV